MTKIVASWNILALIRKVKKNPIGYLSVIDNNSVTRFLWGVKYLLSSKYVLTCQVLKCMSLNLNRLTQMLWGFVDNGPDVPAHCKSNSQNFIYTLIRCLKVSKLDWMRSAEIFWGGEVLFADNEPDVVPQWPRCINRFLVTLGKTAPHRNWPNTIAREGLSRANHS
mgnify:CR=1 FL=1